MRRGGNGFLIVLLVLIGAVVATLVINDGGTIGGLDDADFANGATIAIWGLVLASGLVFTVGRNWSGALRSALVWAVAFAGLICAHAYAPELREVGDRMMAALVPGRAVEVAMPEGRQLMVTRAGDEHFHVDAEVDGKSLSFLVDTGATLVALDRASAERIGIDTSRLRYSERVMTANGMAEAAITRLSSIRIGHIERHDVEAAIMKGDGESAPGRGGLSLLGMSFLNSLASVEFRGERLILTD